MSALPGLAGSEEMIIFVRIEKLWQRVDQPADRHADVSGWRESLSIQ